ncbi:hypothetical protein L1987_46150 [Smallanthus sonchifolius]|uniref:Uncharacterized protein n=1 Tax=Smallanthus sonchifolius TaxID=185202 RepID=A0ACB9FYR8_9ASTR|nr:hypothetical protein L1987_46150 [Smallanthus sonchifolius]
MVSITSDFIQLFSDSLLSSSPSQSTILLLDLFRGRLFKHWSEMRFKLLNKVDDISNISETKGARFPD